ncbi:hypothetical protein AN642_01995 [Epulopiscium sp. SCG-B10WGA-EpuloA2]|nr:hypothetical protein AN642_01995 [Epulopiscium sp. SCG-B10WGA-EpuloA2]
MLEFYLCNLDEKVSNQMVNNDAILIIPNGTHGETKMSIDALFGQDLYQNEISNVGSKWYMDNDYEHRDATMEEIFHLVHDYGIGTSQNPQADNKIAQKIADATQNALPKNKEFWGIEGLWGLGDLDWLLELEKEGSLEQEYFVSVLESYYGLWEAWTEADGGMWGSYIAKTRNEIKQKDALGYEMITSFLPKYINTLMPVDESFTGTFDMNYNPDKPYTFKTQYLKHIILHGKNNINIIGNNQDNIFMGNAGCNEIDGKTGTNIVQLKGLSSEYIITNDENGTITIIDNISDRDGKLILKNIHILRFTDKDIEL